MIIDTPVLPRRPVKFGLHEKGDHPSEFFIRDLAQNPRVLRYEALVGEGNPIVVTCVGRNRSKPVLAVQFGPNGQCIDYEIMKPDGTKEIVPKRSPAEIFKYAIDLIGDLWFGGHFNETEDLWLAMTVRPK